MVGVHRPGLALIMETCPYGSVLTCGCLRNPMKTSINLGWLKAYVHNGMFTTYTINWCRISQPSTVTGTAPLGPALIHGVTELRKLGHQKKKRMGLMLGGLLSCTKYFEDYQNHHLVGGIHTPLKNMKVSWEGLSHILWKIRNV